MAEPIDISLPETFHRAKRTMLLFCAALFVLGVAAPQESQKLGLTLVSLDLPTHILAWLLWGSAVYYALGFGVEVKVARRLNSAVMRSSGSANLEAQLLASSKQLQQATRSFEEKCEGAADRFAMVAAQIENHPDRKQRPLNRDKAYAAWSAMAAAIAVEPGKWTLDQVKAADRALQEMEGALDGVTANNTELTQSIDDLRGLLAAVPTVLENVNANITRTHNDMTKLSPLIAAERRASFWWWEVGGAATAFLLSSAMVASMLYDGARLFIVYIAR